MFSIYYGISFFKCVIGVRVGGFQQQFGNNLKESTSCIWFYKIVEVVVSWGVESEGINLVIQDNFSLRGRNLKRNWKNGIDYFN